jgi:hypothetical protein
MGAHGGWLVAHGVEGMSWRADSSRASGYHGARLLELSTGCAEFRARDA